MWIMVCYKRYLRRLHAVKIAGWYYEDLTAFKWGRWLKYKIKLFAIDQYEHKI